ncbi:IS3 family transposase [Fructilactobacillus sanfranciscensis]|uniref:IS3 family transposase n=1 Tax=Fructilactobacillus sanfranciscensis TaxID=1625 RepID=UPI003D15DBA9
MLVWKAFFNQLKVGTTRNNHYQTLNQLQTSTKDYLFYYNNYRIKEKLEGLSPVKYRQQTFQLVA